VITEDLQVLEKFCTGCGACIEVCPVRGVEEERAISLAKMGSGLMCPRINVDSCVSCKACFRTCPQTAKFQNEKIVTFEDYCGLLGDCYYGYSKDREHRYEAATAGIATEIAAYLLKSGRVDGVVSSYQDENNNIITNIFSDSLAVKRTRGSIYRQVNLLNGLVDKIIEGGHRRLVLIGLPCHVAGLIALKKRHSYLRDYVEFVTIALFCKQTKTEEYSEYVRRCLKAENDQPIIYRGKGWPGLTRVTDGNSIFSNNSRLGLLWGSFAFSPDYCMMCNDPLGVVSDMSIGDAWLSKYSCDQIGSSFVTANTSKGRETLCNMKSLGILQLEEIKKNDVITSQNKKVIEFKLRNKISNKKKSAYLTEYNLTGGGGVRIIKRKIEKLYSLKIINKFPDLVFKCFTLMIIKSYKYMLR